MGCILGNQYLPPIAYFAHWLHYGEIALEAHEHYQKRTWRNKTCILGSTGPQSLTVPLQKGKHQQMGIREVRIAYEENWTRKHIRSISTTYGNTAFVEEVMAGLAPILSQGHATLWELNLACLDYVILLLRGDWSYRWTDAYLKNYKGSVDQRMGIACGASAKTGLPEYGQVLRMYKPHLPNLSILDALCHLGPGTYDYLNRYAHKLFETT